MAAALAALTPPLRAVADGVEVRVRLTPKASRAGVAGLVAEADGGARLKVAVTAAPEAGRANAALVALLAKEWDLPKTSLTVTAGATDRRKTITVAGEPRALAARLAAWIAGLA